MRPRPPRACPERLRFILVADDVMLATLGEVLLEPTLTTLGNFLARRGLGQLHGGRLPAGGLRLEHRAHLHPDAGETLLLRLPAPAGHGLQLGDVRQRGRQRPRGRHRHLPRHGRAGCLEPGLAQPSAGTLDLHSTQIRASAFGGESVSLADSLALTASATLNVGCDQLLCNDVNCTDVFTTGVDASGAVSCAALTATGTVAGATLSSSGAVLGSSLSITGAASVGLLSATGITGSTLTINNTANAGNFTTVGDVHGRPAASFAASGAVTGATLTITGAASAGPLDCESLDCTFRRSVDGQRGARRRDELGHGLRAAALRVQHAHRDQHLRLLGRSLLDEELGGLEQAADFQQQRGLRQRPGAAAAGQPERAGLPGARRRGAPVRAHHDQRRGAGADEEPLDAEEPRLPRDCRQHGQRGLQHELHQLVGQPGEDGDGRGQRGRAAAAVRLRGGQAVQAPGHERGPEVGLRLRRLRRNKLTGAARWSDGTEMVTLDYSHLTSVLWGARKGFQARLGKVEALQAQRGPKNP